MCIRIRSRSRPTRAMEAIKSVLDETGASWRDVVKVTKYLTDFRDADAMHKTMHKYFGDWKPASTTVCINQLSSPGARIELDMIVALPKKAMMALRLPHLVSRHRRRRVFRAFPRAEMVRHRAAVEALLVEAQCDHLVFCGANRAGSIVQYLTQWPVTAEAVGVFTPGLRDALFVQWINHQPQASIIADQADVAWGGESSIASAVAVLKKRGARSGRVATIGPLSADQHAVIAAAFGPPKSLNKAYTRPPSGQIRGGDRLAAHRRAFHRSRHGGLARRLEARLERARARRSDRARLRQARRRQFHPLHRRHVDGRARSRRAAAISADAQGAEGRRGGRRDHRDVLGLSGPGAALVSRSGEPTPLYRDLHAAADAAFDAITRC